MNTYDVIIIGAGATGTAIARQLCRYQLSVAVLEKEQELAFGVSKSNSGIIHPGTQHAALSLRGKLCLQGNILTRRIAKEVGVDLKQVGELIVAFDEVEQLKLLEIKREAQRLGVPGLCMVGPGWLRKHEPNLNKQVTAALYAPTAAIISPYRWVYDLAENAKDNGIEIYTKTKVDKIVVQGMQSFEIYSSAGVFKAKFVINCAGLFADDISRMVGVDDFVISARKGEEFILDKKLQNLTNHLIFPVPSKDSKGILVIKTSDGNPMIGPTAQMVDDKYDLSTSTQGLNKVIAGSRKLVPSIDPDDIIAYFAGLRPVAGDDFIIRHEDKAPGFINVAGIQSPGLTAAPAIAVMVQGLLKDRGLKLTRKLMFKRYRKKSVHLFSSSFARARRLIKKDNSYGDIVCRCEMVSAKEIQDAIRRGAVTLDGIKFRTRCQSGRCHGSFCTTRVMKILAQETKQPLTKITKRGAGSEVVKQDRAYG